MRVLVVGPSDTRSRGGMATVIHDIRNSDIINEQFDVDIHASYIDGNIVMRLAYSLFGYIKYCFRVKKYDLIHIHVSKDGSTFRKIFYQKTAKNKKTILHIHSGKYIDFYQNLNMRKKIKVKNFFQEADDVIVLSDFWKDYFTKTMDIEHCEIMRNCVDEEKYTAAVSDPFEHRNSFLFLGMINEKKGVYDLIDAMEAAIKINPELKLYIAGAGETVRAKKIVSQKKLEDKIVFCGWVSGDDKIELMKKCATFVLPSYYEGLPMSILECMAAGKAIISTKVGSIPEVVKDENGILIKPGDVNALTDALLQCNRHPKMLKVMSENNIKKIKEQYNIKIAEKKLCEIYGAFR